MKPVSAPRRRLLGAALSSSFASLAGPLAAAPTNAEPLTLLINEGATYRSGAEGPRTTYKAIADDLTRLLHAQVRIEPVAQYPQVAAALSKQTVDLAFVHPAHIALAPVADGTYTVVAASTAHLAYRAHFLARREVPARSLTDLVKFLATPGAKPLGVPQAGSITDVLVRLSLRDAARAVNLPQPQLKYSAFQDAMPTMIEQGFADIACTGSDALAKSWSAAGGRIVAQSRAVPVKTLLASSRLSREQTDLFRTYFVGLTRTAEGVARLERIGLPGGFSELDPVATVATAQWLGSLGRT